MIKNLMYTHMCMYTHIFQSILNTYLLVCLNHSYSVQNRKQILKNIHQANICISITNIISLKKLAKGKNS